jgi:hypothetical protein
MASSVPSTLLLNQHCGSTGHVTWHCVCLQQQLAGSDVWPCKQKACNLRQRRKLHLLVLLLSLSW